MYGAPSGSPLHNACIPRKAVLVRMLQVSKGFSLIRSEKKGTHGRPVEALLTLEQARKKRT